MKKFLSTVLAFVMVLSLSIPTFAIERQVHTSDSKVVMNEYTALKQLATRNRATLSAEGYSSDEINSIQNYQGLYRAHIESLRMLDDAALLKNGYTTSQIGLIRSFTGTDAEMSSLGSTLTISAAPALFKYTTGGRTTGRLDYTWYWSGIPAFKTKDMVAVSWNSWKVTRNSSYVQYFGINTGSYYTDRTATFTNAENDQGGLGGAGHKFAMTLNDNYYYARNGGGSFVLESDTFAKKDFYYYIEYGHTRFAFDIGFNVSAPGGASVGLTFTVDTLPADHTSGSYRW